MRIGVNLSSLGLSFRQALERIAGMGVGGVQVDAFGDLMPQRLTETGRREIRTILRTFDLQLAALNCPLRHGIDVVENLDARIEHIRQVMSLAFELGSRLAIIQCPKISDETDSPRAVAMHNALLDLGRHGDRIGMTLAVEIGFDPADKVRDYFNTFECGGLGVDYDPVNLMLHGHDPIRNLLPLQGKIVHTHARDARLATVSSTDAEVPLGAGDLNWLSYFGTLGAMEYRGWVIVKRDLGDKRLADIEAGVKFLRRTMMPI